MKLIKKFFKYPLVIIFFGLILICSCIDVLEPERAFSNVENRSLAKFPKFTIEELFNNEYTAKYENYVNDQFLFRDMWIGVKSRIEWLLLKTENNDILYGKDGYQFQKNYTIDNDQLTTNLNALNEFTQRNGSKVSVLIVPTASYVLSNKLTWNPPLFDEDSLFDTIYENTNTANIIDIRKSLIQNKDDYIYYRTDHHWTTYGAYLAYQEYAYAKSFEPFDLSKHKAVNVDNFYGTHFSKSKLFNSTPDTLTFYDIDNTIQVDDLEMPIYDRSKLNTIDKYALFLYGNMGYITVNGDENANNSATINGKLLVIKDSYANSFVPFLTKNYSQIDVVDFRFYNSNIGELLKNSDYDDILILYNSSTFAKDGNFAKILFE